MRLLFVIALSLVAIPARAQPAKTAPATAAVQQADATLKKLLSSNAPATNVAQAVKSLIDINELGKQAMATHWSNLKPAEQTTFLQLLDSLIQASYVAARQTNLSYSVQYTGESTDPKGHTIVHTKIATQRRNRPITISVDYVMIKNGASYRAFDVITDGVSLVTNYQSMFNGMIAKGGVSGMLQTMQNKLQQIQSAPAGGSAAPASGTAPAKPSKP